MLKERLLEIQVHSGIKNKFVALRQKGDSQIENPTSAIFHKARRSSRQVSRVFVEQASHEGELPLRESIHFSKEQCDNWSLIEHS